MYYLNLSRPPFRSDLRAFTLIGEHFADVCSLASSLRSYLQRSRAKLAAVGARSRTRAIPARVSPTRTPLTFPKRHVKNVRYSAHAVFVATIPNCATDATCERQTVERRGEGKHCRQPREAKFAFAPYDRWTKSAIAIFKTCSFLLRIHRERRVSLVLTDDSWQVTADKWQMTTDFKSFSRRLTSSVAFSSLIFMNKGN